MSLTKNKQSNKYQTYPHYLLWYYRGKKVIYRHTYRKRRFTLLLQGLTKLSRCGKVRFRIEYMPPVDGEPIENSIPWTNPKEALKVGRIFTAKEEMDFIIGYNERH